MAAKDPCDEIPSPPTKRKNKFSRLFKNKRYEDIHVDVFRKVAELEEKSRVVCPLELCQVCR